MRQLPRSGSGGGLPPPPVPATAGLENRAAEVMGQRRADWVSGGHGRSDLLPVRRWVMKAQVVQVTAQKGQRSGNFLPLSQTPMGGQRSRIRVCSDPQDISRLIGKVWEDD